MSLILRAVDRKNEGSDFAWTLGQVIGQDGTLLQVVDVSAVTLIVFDKQDPRTILLTKALDPTQVFFNIPQLDRRWDSDTVGYNFATYLGQSEVFSGTNIERGGHTYRIEILIQTTGENGSGFLKGAMEVYSVPTVSGVGISGTGGPGSGGPPPTGDFSISVSPQTQSLALGGSTTFTINSTAFNSFAGAIDLVATQTGGGTIAGVTFAFVPNPIIAGGSSTLTVTTNASSTPSGIYSLTITGTSGTLVHTAVCSINVTALDFVLSVVPAARSVSAPSTADFTVTVTGVNGFNTPVVLTAVSSPSDSHVTFAFTPSTVTPTGTSDFLVTIGALAPTALYNITITGTAGAISHTIQVNVAVAGAPQQEWTDFTLDTNAQVIYVSNAGSDSNNGLSPATPKLTINGVNGGRSLVRNGIGDWLLLRKGDTFNEANIPWFTNGPTLNMNQTNRQLISAYWDGGGTPPDRPTIQTGDNTGFFIQTGGGSNLAFVGLKITSGVNVTSNDAASISNITPNNNVLVEDCYISQYCKGMIYYADTTANPLPPPNGSGARCTNFKFRHNIVVDCTAPGTQDSSGLFVSNIDGLLIEKNLFDSNGWNQFNTLGTFRRHNLYVQNGCTNVICNDNIFMRSEGLDTMRSGGTIKNNVALNCAISFKIGDVGAGEHAEPAGVAIEVRGNVALGGGQIPVPGGGLTSGWGLVFDNVSSGLVDGNIIAHNYYGPAANALILKPDPDNLRSLENTTLSNNVFYDWSDLVAPSNGFLIGFQGFAGVGFTFNNVFHDNEFQDIGPIGGGNNDGQVLVQHDNAATAAPTIITGYQNHYTTNRQPANWFSVQGANHSLAEYLGLIHDPVAGHSISTAQATSFPFPTRDHLTWSVSVGGVATIDSIAAGFRAQSRQNYNTTYTADTLNTYIRAGFGVTYTP